MEEDKVVPDASVPDQVQDAAPETPEQINWRRFREERARDRKAMEESERVAKQKEDEARALKEAMEALLSKPQSNTPLDDDDEDARIQKKVEAALKLREQQMEKDRMDREQQEMPKRLASTYSDFDKVCTSENLDYLEYHYPEIASAFRHMPENFDKWSSVYKAVKRFVPNPDSRKDERRAEKNSMKPQSMSASGVTSTGDQAPKILDEKRRADNYARMQRVMRGG